MPIQVFTGSSGLLQMKTAFRKNRKHYLQEALGLALFMISACFFGAMIFAKSSPWHHGINSGLLKNVLMGIFMGCTALFIFYSPWTAPSGSHINPAVTLTFLRLGKVCRYDALFFLLFQTAGGIAAVYVMQWWMGSMLTDQPVNSVVTVPGKQGPWWAMITEFSIAFITMSMVLFTSNHNRLKKYTRIFSGFLVCIWVIVAGPLSGFGMNPARSLASALPANTWTNFWIYMLVPFAGMLTAAEFFLFTRKKKESEKEKSKEIRSVKRKIIEPLEFVL